MLGYLCRSTLQGIQLTLKVTSALPWPQKWLKAKIKNYRPAPAETKVFLRAASSTRSIF